jgi:hypothetical protein
MSNATATRKPRQRRQKPARFCNVARTGNTAVLTLREKYAKGDKIDTYALDVILSEVGGRGVELVKPNGTRYHVLLHGRLSACSCPGFERWGWRVDENGKPYACKHVDATLALENAKRL